MRIGFIYVLSPLTLDADGGQSQGATVDGGILEPVIGDAYTFSICYPSSYAFPICYILLYFAPELCLYLYGFLTWRKASALRKKITISPLRCLVKFCHNFSVFHHLDMPRILFVSGFHPATRARELAYEFERSVSSSGRCRAMLNSVALQLWPSNPL